jgi:hypothetical protein
MKLFLRAQLRHRRQLFKQRDGAFEIEFLTAAPTFAVEEFVAFLCTARRRSAENNFTDSTSLMP